MKYDKVLLKDKADLTDVVLSRLPHANILGAYESTSHIEDPDEIKVLSVKFSKVGKTTFDRYKNLEWIVCRSHGVDMINLELARTNNVGIVALSPTAKPCANWIYNHMETERPSVIFGNGSISRKLQEKVDDYRVVDSKTPREDIDKYVKESVNIISTLPYTKRTENYFNREFFAKIDHPVNFISISRGELIDNSALLDFSIGDNLKLAVVDMLVTSGRDILSRRKNVRYTEHTAWKFNQPMDNGKLGGYVNVQFAENLKNTIDQCLEDNVEHPHLPRQDRVWF